MIQELQLRILPEEAASEQSLKQVVARETGTSVPHIHAVRVLKRSIDARQRTIFVNVKLRAFIDEVPDERNSGRWNIKTCRPGNLSWW